MKRLFLLLALLFSPVAALAENTVEARDGWAWLEEDGRSVRIFAQILNTSREEQTITGANFPADSAAIVSLMDGRSQTASFRLRRRNDLFLKPGHKHILVTGLSSPLQVGQTVSVSLTLASGEGVTFSALIRPEGLGGTGRIRRQ